LAGDVRELKNAIERSLVLSRGEEIGCERFAGRGVAWHARCAKGGDDGEDLGLKEKDFREAKRKFEIAYLFATAWRASVEYFADGGDDWAAPAKFAGAASRTGIRRPGQEIPEEEE